MALRGFQLEINVPPSINVLNILYVSVQSHRLAAYKMTFPTDQFRGCRLAAFLLYLSPLAWNGVVKKRLVLRPWLLQPD